jgi:transposase InsO family protein
MATYEGVGHAVTKLDDLFRFCNEERCHQALAYRTPAAIYKAA